LASAAGEAPAPFDFAQGRLAAAATALVCGYRYFAQLY